MSVCCINFSTTASQPGRQAGGAHRRAPSEKPLFVTAAAAAAAAASLSVGCFASPLFLTFNTTTWSGFFADPSLNSFIYSAAEEGGERERRLPPPDALGGPAVIRLTRDEAISPYGQNRKPKKKESSLTEKQTSWRRIQPLLCRWPLLFLMKCLDDNAPVISSGKALRSRCWCWSAR